MTDVCKVHKLYVDSRGELFPKTSLSEIVDGIKEAVIRKYIESECLLHGSTCSEAKVYLDYTYLYGENQPKLSSEYEEQIRKALEDIGLKYRSWPCDKEISLSWEKDPKSYYGPPKISEFLKEFREQYSKELEEQRPLWNQIKEFILNSIQKDCEKHAREKRYECSISVNYVNNYYIQQRPDMDKNTRIQKFQVELPILAKMNKSFIKDFLTEDLSNGGFSVKSGYNNVGYNDIGYKLTINWSTPGGNMTKAATRK